MIRSERAVVTGRLKRSHPLDASPPFTPYTSPVTDDYPSKKRVCCRDMHGMQPMSPISRVCSSVMAHILTYLQPRDIENFGETCREHKRISTNSVLWTNLSLDYANDINVQAIFNLIKRTAPGVQPLMNMSISGYTETDRDVDHMCNCIVGEICAICTASRDSGQSNRLNDASTQICALGSNSQNGSCSRCQDVEALQPYLSKLQSLKLEQIGCVSACFLRGVLLQSPQLRTVTVSQNIDVNILVGSVATSCPLLEKISFSYMNVTSSNGEGMFDHPLLQPEVGLSLAEGCPLLKCVRLRHYTIDEDGVQAVLHLPRVEETDFSDNESLHGMFLTDIPSRWPGLRTLTLRDCTGMEDEHVAAFAFLLAQGGCPELAYVDVSCQWAFFNTSLLHKAAREELEKRREVPDPRANDGRAPAGAVLRWREDQCEVEGFGVDPEDGIDTMELMQESYSERDRHIKCDREIQDASARMSSGYVCQIANRFS